MNGFSVTPVELRNSAAVMHKLLDECAGQPAAKYWSDPGEIGDSELAVALAEFQQASWEISTVLLADSTEMVQRLHSTATRYELVDAEMADSFADIHKETGSDQRL
jgi:hypothetical protein